MTAEEEQDQYGRAAERYQSRLARSRRDEAARAESEVSNWPAAASERSSPQNGGRSLPGDVRPVAS